MKKIGLMMVLALVLVGCTKTSESDLEKVVVVLDYVPNTNHSGMYYALEKGYYEAEGLDVELIEPGNDSTSLTLIAAGKGDLGISYQEDVTYARSSTEPMPIKAIATIIENNTSGFVVSKDSGIKSPKDFDHKVYSGWQSASEEAVLNSVMNKYGADFSTLTMVGSSGAGGQDLGKGIDIKWFFEAWDLVQAEMSGIDLHYMALKDLDPRLNYYTPVIVASENVIDTKPEMLSKFMSATKKGYQAIIQDPKEGATILHKYAPENDLDMLIQSQERLSPLYTSNPNTWGLMDITVWDNYTEFMIETGLITIPLDSNDLYTNQFLGE